MIRQTGTIGLSSPPGCPRLVRTKANIKKVKGRVLRKSRVSARKIVPELDISRISVRRILKNDIGLRSYKEIMEPSLSDDQRVKREKIYKLCSNKGRGRIRYQIGLSPLFQSHQAQLYIEQKLLLM